MEQRIGLTNFGKEAKRLQLFIRVLAISLLLCIAFSWRLWISREHYPFLPLFNLVPAFPFPIDYAVLVALVGSLCGVVVRPYAKRWVLLSTGLFAVLFLQDQSRLWPSFYQFFIQLILLLTLREKDEGEDAHRTLTAMRFILAGVYFWGGVQKLNKHFFHEEFPWFIEPITSRLPFELPALPTLGLFAAFFEILFAVALLSKRFRHIALFDAMLMHALIFFCIGPLRGDWNNSSWIWGLTVGVQAWILYFKAPPFDVRTMFRSTGWRLLLAALALLLVGVLPVLNNFNRWDSALSFNVYSGNVDYAEIHLRADVVEQLPQGIRQHVTMQPDRGFGILDLNAWAQYEFNANPYPETRIYLAILHKICSYVPAEAVQLHIREKASWMTPKTEHQYTCTGGAG